VNWGQSVHLWCGAVVPGGELNMVRYLFGRDVWILASKFVRLSPTRRLRKTIVVFSFRLLKWQSKRTIRVESSSGGKSKRKAMFSKGRSSILTYQSQQ
jgi:hypothetical protein